MAFSSQLACFELVLHPLSGLLWVGPYFGWLLHSKRAGPALVFALLSLPCAVAVRAQLQRHVQRRRVQRHLHPPPVLGPQLSLAVEAPLLCPLVLLPLPRPQAAQTHMMHTLDALCAEIELRITAAIVTRAMMAAGALILVTQYLM